MGKQVKDGLDKDPKSWLKYYENKVTNDERFTSATPEDQMRFLGNVFDKYGSFMYNGAKTQEAQDSIRNDYITTTLQKKNTPEEPEVEAWEPPVYSKDSILPSPEAESTRVEAPPVFTEDPDVTLPEEEQPKPPQPINQAVSDIQANVESIYKAKGWPSPNMKIQQYQERAKELQQMVLDGKMNEDDYEGKLEEVLNEIGLGRDGDKVYVYPNEVELYRQEIDKAYRQHLTDRSATEKDGFFKDVLDALNVGSQRVMTSPTRILAISEKMANGMLNLINQKERLGSTYWADKAKIEEEIQGTMKANNERYTEGITEMAKRGNMRGAVGQTILAVAENAPLMALLVMGNAAGATDATLAYMGMDKAADEYMRNEENPDMTELVKIVNAVGKGMSEVVFERMGTMTIVDNVRKGIREAGEMAVRDQLIRSYTPMFQKHLATLMGASSKALGEGAEEMATEFTDNLLDWANDKDVDVGANVADAGIVGAVFGSMLASPQIYAELKGGKSEYVKSLADAIPDNLDFERKMAVAELMIEADQIGMNGQDGMSEAQKIRVKEINEEMNTLLGITPEDQAAANQEKYGFELAPEYVEAVREQRAYFDDMKIKEAQERLNLPNTPDLNIEDHTDETLDMIDRGEAVVNDRLKLAADNLYGEYKRLAAMKEADQREYSTDQINDMMTVLEEEITLLNDRINEQAEKGEFIVKEVELTDEIKVSEIAEEGEGTDPEGQPGPVVPPAKPEDFKKPPEEPPAEPPATAGAVVEQPIEEEPPGESVQQLGDPALIRETPIGQVNEGLGAIETEANALLQPLTDKRAELNARLDTEFKGRLTLEKKKGRTEVRNELVRVRGQMDDIIEKWETDVAEYADQIKPHIETAIRDLVPTISDEKLEATLNTVWDKLNEKELSKEDAAKTVDDYILEALTEQPVEEDITVAQEGDMWVVTQQGDAVVTQEFKTEKEAVDFAEGVKVITGGKITYEEKKAKTDEKKARAAKHDILLSRVRQYNELPKRSAKAAPLYQLIGKAVADLGYNIGMKGENLVVTDEAGKEIRMTPDRTPKEVTEAHPLLTEYEDPGFVDFVNRIMDVPQSLMSYDVPLKASEIESAIKNIKAGKKTVAANKLLDALEESMEGGVIVLKPSRNTPRVEIPIEEFNNLIDNVTLTKFTNQFGELSPDNVEEAVNMGLMTEEEKDLYLKNLEDEIEKEEEAGPEPVEERTGDLEGEGAVEEQKPISSFKKGDTVRLAEADDRVFQIIKVGKTDTTAWAFSLEGSKSKMSIPNDEMVILESEATTLSAAAQDKLLKVFMGGKPITMDTTNSEEMRTINELVDAKLITKVGPYKDGFQDYILVGAENPIEKPLDVTDELKAMQDLLDDPDLDFGGGMEMAAGGTGSVDASTKMLQTATKLITKLADAKIYDMDQMMRKIIPVIDRQKLNALLPYLKQGYMAYWATAPDDVKYQMNIVGVGSYDTADIDRVIDMFKPEKEAPPVEEVPEYDNPDYREELTKVIRGWESIGQTAIARMLEKFLYKAPEAVKKEEIPWQEYMVRQRNRLRKFQLENDIKLGKTEEQPEGLSNEEAFTWEIKNALVTGKPLENWNDIKRIGKKHGIERKDVLRDQYELAVVEVARSMAQNMDISREDRWTQIYNLYQTAPGISQTARTAEVKEKQQYSTPIPISFLMGEYVNAMEVGTVMDPSAGNGSLLIGAKKSAVRANDIDTRRNRNLAAQGYRVFKEDSTHGIAKLLDVPYVDALLINPPFGGPKEQYNGYPLSGEYVPVAYALESLKPEGKAAIIVGGHIEFKDNGQMKGKDLMFFNWLNKYFNVEDVIQVPGEMYRKMGAQYPIKIILVNGRKAAPEGAAPLYSESFDPILGWSDLKFRILSKTNKPNEQTVLQSKVDANRGDDSLVVGDDTGGITDQPTGRTDTQDPGEDNPPTPTGTIRPEDDPTRKPVGPEPSGEPGRASRGYNEPPSISKPERESVPEGGKPTPKGFGTIQPGRNKEDLPVRDLGKPTERTKRDLEISERTGDEVTPYVPLSQVGSGNYIIPASIAVEVEDALMQLKDEVGDVDQYVMEKLGYNSLEEMSEALFAEQVDGVGQTIFNVEGGNAMIIGHQTGTGKGRIAAALIRYAIKEGKMPVFITKSPDLFSDMYRDLIDIGSPTVKPFIVNKNFPGGGKVKIYHPETNEVLHEVDPGQNRRVIGKGENIGTGILPEGIDVVMATYSQFTTEGRDDAKRAFLNKLAQDHNVVFIMDESHEASGMSNTGEFFMNWLQSTGGGLFASATYAKRPDNMPLYAMKTVLTENNMTHEELIDAIKAGGPALQEIITLQLAEAGQFSKIGFKMDAEMNYMVMGDTDPDQRTYNPELGEEMVRKFDGVTSMLQEIINFQKDHVNPILQGMNEDVKKQGAMVEVRKGTTQAGISNSPYFSRVWSIIDQLLLSIKVKEAIPLIVADLKAGRKPVIALKSTMEKMITDMADEGLFKKGDTIPLDFSYVLRKGMDTVMKFTEKDDQGNGTPDKLGPENLTPEGREAYYDMMERINKLTTDIPISPIDVLRKGIEAAGFEAVEITGRGTMFEMNDDMTMGKYVNNDRGQKMKAVQKFNNNPGVAAIINKAGSTGISMHSSPKFADTNQRSMWILQNDLDINVVVQILGRIYRAKQLNKPIYNILTSTLPAELRMFMMNAKKLKSLDANVSGNQKQSKSLIDVPDFLNKYGDKVVYEYLKENSEVNNLIGDPLKIKESEDDANVDMTNAAHRVTGKIQILPSYMQEEFNRDIIERYESAIEYLDSTGQNDLMVTSENLEAEVKETDVAVHGNGGWSSFGDDTNLQTVEANVIRKPLNKQELDAILEEIPDNHSEDLQKQMEAGVEQRMNDQLARVQDSYETHRQALKKRIAEKKGLTEEEKEREYAIEEENLSDRERFQLQGIKDNANNNKARFNNYIDYFTPGRALEIPFTDDEQLDGFKLSKGVFLGFDVNQNKPNPWIPSNFMLKFATTDSRRVIRIPVSKSNHLDAIRGNSNHISENQGREILEEWDTLRKGRKRETRYIATENVLQGMTMFKKGRLIQFTKMDGTIDKGILMPENWKKPDESIARMPINKAIDIVKNLLPGKFVEDWSGDIMIKKLSYGSPQRYELRVPATTKRGSKYYSNEQLRDLVDDGLFEQNGDRMIATFAEYQLEDLLNILNERFKIVLEVDAKDVAQAYDQTDTHATMASYGAGVRTKPKNRKGLSNPNNEVLGAKEKSVANRVQPAPITGGTPKKMWEIQYDLSKSVGFKLRYSRRPSKRGKAIGSYQPGSGKVVIKWNGDLNTTAHEIGHALDDAFGLLGPEAAGRWGELKDELEQLWEYGSDPPRGHPNPDQYRMMEGMAEFIRAFMVNPTQAKRRFPTTYSWVKERVGDDEQTWTGLLEFSKDVREWWGAPAAEQILSRINTGDPIKTPKFVFNRESPEGQFQMTYWDRFARKYVNFFRPLEMAYRWGMEQQGIDVTDPTQLAPSQNFETLARLHLGLDVKMRNAMEKGLVDFHGNRVFDEETHEPLSFHLLFQQIPNHTWADIKTNLDEAIMYGMAHRIKEIPWKVQARQIRMDLNENVDMLPPEEILKKHPYIMEVYADKINRIYDQMAKGELDPKDVFLPEGRYDFTDMVIAGVAQEGMRDYDVAVKAVEKFEELKRTDPEKHEWIKEFNRIYQAIGVQVMTYARDSGLISEKAFEQIDNENMHYMAMKRLFAMSPQDIVEGKASEGVSITSSGAPNKSGLVRIVIHPIKGSRKEIRDPIEALIESYHKVVQNGDLNYVVASFARAFTPSRDLYSGQPIKIGEVAWVSPSPEQNSIPFYVKGKRMYLTIPDPELFKLMVNLIPDSGGAGSTTVKILSALPQLLRRSVVTAPIFAARNIVRDFQHFLVLGQGLRYWRPFSKNLDIGGNKFLKEEFEISGAGQFGYLVSSKRGYNDLMKAAMFKVSQDPKKYIYAPKQGMRKASEAIFGTMMKGERVTRMIQFKAAIRQGMKKHGLSQEEAIYRAAFLSRDLMDFMVGGTVTKELNRVIVFLNPAVRGLDKIARSIKDPKQRASVLGKMGLVLAVPGILNSLLIALMADDDQKEEYLNAPAYQRDMFYRIPVGDGWVFIPRPFELATITTIFQRATDKYVLGDENAFNKDFFKSISHLISPVDVAGLFGGYGGVVAAMFNKDMFRQKNIIPPEDVGLSIALRNTEYASQFGQLVQEASDIFTKGKHDYLVDARKVDAFILGQGSYYGSAFLKATELMIPGKGQAKYQFNPTSTGFFKFANAYSEPNTQYMLRIFKKHPWTREMTEYGEFKRLIYHYFTPEVQRDRVKRREIGAALREYSEAQRAAWKDIDFDNESYARKQIEQARRNY